MSVAIIVTVNLISIVLFIKKTHSLRTRAMYLVINLTVVDMFVEGFSDFSLFITVTLFKEANILYIGHSVDLQIFSSVVGAPDDCFLLEEAKSFFCGNFYR